MSNTTDNLRRGDWTSKELQMVREFYPTMRTTKLAAMLHRAPHSVKAQANKMGVHKASGVVTRPSHYARKEEQPQQEAPTPRLCHRCVNYPCFRGIDNLETDFARVGCRSYKEREPQQLNPS